MDTSWLARRVMLFVLVPLATISLIACGPDSASPATPIAAAEINVLQVASTAVPSPIAIPLPSPTPLPQQISIDSPPPGTLVGSPAQVTGRTARMPAGGQLEYQVVNATNQVIGTGTMAVRALSDGSGAFDTPLTFSVPRDGGPISAQLFERASNGSLVAVSGVEMFVQSQTQSISIDTPPAGAQVGSPVVLTGRLARLPNQSRLNYRITNSSQQQIGAGTFEVRGAPGRPAAYIGSLTFDLPFDGDTIAVQISDQDASGAVVASQSINLYVAPVPQQILIDTPPRGTIIGSPMVVTGRTVRFPFNGRLNYRFTDAGGTQIGAGTFTVPGNVAAGTQFNTQATFNLPRDGGLVRLTIYDQDPANGAVRASASLDLDVLAQYQRIDIDTPPAATQVGSPVVLTGRTNLYPNKGLLRYRVLNDRAAEIGSGTFQVAGRAGTRGRFNASLSFAEPANGGNIRVELVDQADNGSEIAKAEVALVVAPPPPPQIFIDTPPSATQVGSPVVITGRVTYMPPNGQLAYRVRDAAGNVIGLGNIRVVADGRGARFNAAPTFTEPVLGGNIVVEIVGAIPTAGAAPVSASITLYVAPRPGR